MATKRRARTGSPVADRTAARRRSGRRRRNAWLLPVLGIATVLVVLIIAAVAVNQAGSTNSASPTAVPTVQARNANLPDYGGVPPTFGIGVLDNRFGLAKPETAPALGTTAPDFAWNTLTGVQHLSSLRGQPVLLEFFAPWCPQCQHEAPLMNIFATSKEFKGLQILAVSASPYGKDYESKGSEAPISMADMTWYKNTFGALYPLVFDQQSRIFNLYGYGSGYPTFWIIDASGKVRFTTSKFISATDLTAQIKKVL